MPRAKPTVALHLTSVRLTRAQQVTLRRRGGAAWLREQLDKPLRERNNYTVRKQNITAVREYLRSKPEGAVPAEISAACGVPHTSTVNALQAMPDAYVAGWKTSRGQGGYAAVWRVFIPPETPPKPQPKRRRTPNVRT